MPKDWRPVPAADLPDGLLLFDGYCHVCSRSVRFFLVRDHAQQFIYVPCQSPWGNEIMARFGIDREFAESFAFVDKGRILFKSDAGIAALSRLPLWRWTALLGYVPRALRDRAYDIMARNRYNWFGKRAQCMTLPPGIRARFHTESPDL